MKTEKGVVVVLYKVSRRNRRYLVLNRKKNWEGWEMPKGHLEEDDYEETVKLELHEEAGIDEEAIQSIESMDETLEWEFEDEDGETIKREYKAYIVKVDEEVTPSVENNPHDEHSMGLFLNYEDAVALLTYDSQQDILEKAEETLG